MKKIAFLDRDGTLIFEPPDTKQIDSIEKLEILPNVIDGLKNLLKEGYELVMISNQDGLGTSAFPKKAFEKPQKTFIKQLKKEGIEFYKILVCPHLAKEQCSCRKPKTGLTKDFLKNEKIDYSQSFVLGDRETDMELGKNLGIRCFQMETNTSFPRLAFTKRITKETDILIQCNLDGKGLYQIDTGLNFFNHMLEQLAKHSLIDLVIDAKGDLEIDEHHTVEDTAIVLGSVLSKALVSRKGICRYSTLLPMDDTLAEVAIDLGGRPYLVFNVEFKREMVGDLPTELIEHFFRSLAETLKANIHINVRYSRNEHHKIEAIFKAFAKALRSACEDDLRLKNILPSTKGII